MALPLLNSRKDRKGNFRIKPELPRHTHTSLRGKFIELDGKHVVMRTWNNITFNNDKYILETHPNRPELKDYKIKNCVFKPLILKTITNMDEEF